MSRENVSDEMLMSYVDGELDSGAAEAVARAVKRDPALAARLEGFRVSRDAARDAFAGLLSAPPPERLSAAVMAAPGSEETASPKVVAFRPRRRLLQTVAAMAACLAVAAMGGYWYGQMNTGPTGGLLAGAPGLAEALSQLETGEGRDLALGTLTLLGSYGIDGGTCRAFRLEPAEGEPVRALGCNRGSGWSVEMAVADTGGDAFSPASSRAASSLDAYLDELGASAPLTPEEERALREEGWEN